MGPRVRAILLEDGTGTVEMAEAAPPIDQNESQTRYDAIKSFFRMSDEKRGGAACRIPS